MLYKILWSNTMKSKSLITILIIAIVGALAAAWYFMWYIPHTPAYTLKIIHQAVQDKDADEAYAIKIRNLL